MDRKRDREAEKCPEKCLETDQERVCAGAAGLELRDRQMPLVRLW